jgi:sortase A
MTFTRGPGGPPGAGPRQASTEASPRAGQPGAEQQPGRPDAAQGAPVTTQPAVATSQESGHGQPAGLRGTGPQAGGRDGRGPGGPAGSWPGAPVRIAIGPVISGGLAIMGALLLGLTLNLVVLSGFEEHAAQSSAFDAFRGQLALGTAPVTQTTQKGQLFPVGIPVAILDIPEIGITNAVVFNGTSGSVLMSGPGHQRDTVMPGQAGVSVIQGRASAYGGPFGHLSSLRTGDKFTVTTGQGVNTYTVSDVRVAGDPDPPLPAGEGRLTLETALGSPFVPSGVLRVDARLISTVQPTPALLDLGALPGPERPLGTDPSALLPLFLWLLGLIAVVAGAVIAWHRWGRWHAWIVFGPLALTVGLFTADQITRLLPNLT